MAQTFTNAVASTITTVTTVYTAPALTTGIVIGVVIANTSGTDTTVSVTSVVGATTVYLAQSLPLPANSNITVLSNNNRVVLATGNTIRVAAAASVDAFVSVLQIT
jgi:hypothetical protein